MNKLFPCREGSLWKTIADNLGGAEFTEISQYGDIWFRNDAERMMNSWIREDVEDFLLGWPTGSGTQPIIESK